MATREERLLAKGQALSASLADSSATIRATLDALKEAVRVGVALRSGSTERFRLNDGDNLRLQVGPGESQIQTVVFSKDDFNNIRNATAEDVVAVLNRDLERVEVSKTSDGGILIESNVQTMRVIDGTANDQFNFSTEVQRRDPQGIGRALSAVRRAERGLRNEAKRKHPKGRTPPGGGPGGGAGLLRGPGRGGG